MSEAVHLAADRAVPQLHAVTRAGSPEPAGLSAFTIADFLAMPSTVQGSPVVVAGQQHLGRRIRWLHVIELADSRGLLQGGELILATGIALAQSPAEIGRYVDALADQGVTGLVIELGRRFAAVPSAMVRACNRRDLPLIALRREVSFVKMTEAAHSVILIGQRRLLQVTAAAHERFTLLSSADASVEQLAAAAGELGEGEVVYANLMHQVLAMHAPDGAAEVLLNRWSRKAFTLNQVFGTQVDDAEQCVATPVEVRGQQRGRLVLFTDRPPDRGQVMVAERAAAAIGMRLLLEDDDVVVAGTQRTMLEAIMSGRGGSVEAMHARAAVLGHPTRHRQYLPIVLLTDQRGGQRDVGRILAAGLDGAQLDGLTAQLAPDRWGVLLLLKTDKFGPPAQAFAARVHELWQETGAERPVVARGGLVSELADVRHSFAEATDVALASRAAGPPGERSVIYCVDDVHLRGLLYILRKDPRLQAFAERTLGPLFLRDAVDGGDRVRTLGAYLRFQRNKSLTAQALGVSRPTLYDRLARIQRLLSVDLDDPERSTSLYAAIMVVEATAADPDSAPGHPRTWR
ncbi:PucR family transcriptional regulator [Dactylosporangium sp. NPDC005572]|uniref:PucR family transcriptional regulator n=1 Tax=Dactylosporangium sp. NPDC005572 TaxID=3156889 RepID=UPI0033B0ADCB